MSQHHTSTTYVIDDHTTLNHDSHEPPIEENDLVNKKHSLDNQDESFLPFCSLFKKRKTYNSNETSFSNDVLTLIFLYLDVPDFVNSNPWLVCKQWNQHFFIKGLKFAKLYYHSYFKLNQDQKSSLHGMLKESNLSYKDVFSTLLDCYNRNFTQKQYKLLKQYALHGNKNILTEMEKNLNYEQYDKKFGKQRLSEHRSSMISKTLPELIPYTDFHSWSKAQVLKENLFRHSILLHRRVQEQKGQLCSLTTVTTEYVSFLSNGYPIKVTIVHNIETVGDQICYQTTVRFNDEMAFIFGYSKTKNPVIDYFSLERNPLDIVGHSHVFKYLTLETLEPISTDVYTNIVLYWLAEFIDIPEIQTRKRYFFSFLPAIDRNNNSRNGSTIFSSP
ncbi:hypothetical protein C9374_003506 [Naegleria lovaniensis]|uniref:F-box domain-containing protein n=1 Tax=Naegleria lovaniensis TaxID=51637 RepID=A0AA88KLT9_NAELO|nr:uncharacterized protein C9374_003506 [Naegleria lovaniensis]KAG2385691.1 hypothetical protein C9374_003506 [Naegleria lovaniensis]